MNVLPDIATGSLPVLAVVFDYWDIGLSVGMFAAVFMLVLAIFAQPGKIQISPQREAALATGAADRRTVFEHPLLRPFMWLLLILAHRLAMPRAKEWLRRTLVSAGSPNYYTPEEYLALSMLAGVVLAGSLEVLHMLLGEGQFSYVAPLAGMIFGMGVTLLQIRSKAATRIRQISRQVPYALDLIALAMGAGATFTEAIRTVVRERSNDPFNVELKTVLAEIELGTTRRQALQNLSDRVPLDLLRSIVASVIQAEELGTPLGEVLHSQASLLRLQRSVRAENAAAVASVRILLPGLLILMGVVLAVFAPAIMRMVREGLF